MSNNNKRKRVLKNGNGNFSKQLSELRNLAIALTKDTSIKIEYDEKQPTSSFHYGKNLVTLSLNPYPAYIKTNERIAKKVLDGVLAHELGHKKLSKPLVGYIEKWIEQLKLRNEQLKLKKNIEFPQFASEIVNVVEDRRVDYFMENRYRFDVGKRRSFVKLLVQDMVENNLEEQLKATVKAKGIDKLSRIGLIWSIFVNEGKWGADCSPLWKQLTIEETEDTKECIRIMEKTKYGRLRIDVVNAWKQVYKILKKHIDKDFDVQECYTLVPSEDGGNLKGELSEELRKKLEQMIKAEIEQEKLEEDLKKGSGAGEGTGLEIAPPEPDFNAYAKLVQRNNPEIERLLRKLKKFIRPTLKRNIYQKRGKFMPNLLARAYANSLRRRVERVYIKNDIIHEKEKVSMALVVDYSGSVPRSVALDITTILTEVFGRFVEDYGFAISCFGDNMQRIKTFFESFSNTKARIGNISVNSWGTRVHDILLANLKMFNSVRGERRKILCVASDFDFSDESEAIQLCEQYAKYGIELIFIGFGNYNKIEDFAKNIKGIKRSTIKNAKELPEAFLNVYISTQLG